MKFTQDWFSHNLNKFQHIKSKLGTIKNILEIGAFEGRATCWMLENMLADDGEMHVIDTFKGSEEHVGLDTNSLRSTFDSNISEVKKYSQKVFTYEETSYVGWHDWRVWE